MKFKMKGNQFSFPIIQLEAVERHPSLNIGNGCLKSSNGLMLGTRELEWLHERYSWVLSVYRWNPVSWDLMVPPKERV